MCECVSEDGAVDAPTFMSCGRGGEGGEGTSAGCVGKRTGGGRETPAGRKSRAIDTRRASFFSRRLEIASEARGKASGGRETHRDGARGAHVAVHVEAIHVRGHDPGTGEGEGTEARGRDRSAASRVRTIRETAGGGEAELFPRARADNTPRSTRTWTPAACRPPRRARAWTRSGRRSALRRRARRRA